MTVADMLIAMAVGSLVLLVITMTFLDSTYSFSLVGDYITMDRTNRNTIYRTTGHIRKSKNLISFSTNQLGFNYSGTTNLAYRFDPPNRQSH